MAQEKTVEQLYEQHINPGTARLFRFMGLGSQGIEGRRCYVYDEQGKAYLDFLSNFGVMNLGYCHPKVVQAVEKQLRKLPQTSRYLLDESTAKAAALLAELTPGELQYTFFCNSGTEAVEAALKIARAATGRTKIVSTWNGFHGKSFGALSVSGRNIYRQPFLPLLPEIHHVNFGDLAAMEEAIDNGTAAVIVEPIQGEGGVFVPPEGYLKGIENLCRNKGALLIIDEVQTGMGRTGSLFRSDYEQIEPDLLCLAKALGGGVMPVGAVIGKPKTWEPLIENPWLHSSTFGGNPLACAAALAALEATVEEQLAEQAHEKGKKLLQKLISLQSKYPQVIADVRGAGLLIGLEFFEAGFCGYIISKMVEQQIILGYTLNNDRVVRLEPPLIVSEAEIDRVIDVLEECLSAGMELFCQAQ